MKTISVINALHLDGYKIKIRFNDNTQRTVDFSGFFSAHSHPQFNKYKKISQFKKFKIVTGNIVWGKDWDIIFPVYDLYKGKI